jgi:hypothetical protein
MKVIAITPDGKTDSVGQLIVEGLYENNVEVIATDAGNSVRQTYSDDEVVEHSKTADYIFVIWGKKRSNNYPKYYLLNKINQPEKTLYIDGSEWTATGYPNINQVEKSLTDTSVLRGNPWFNEEMLRYCRWYFKRECYQQDADMGIIPLMIGTRLNMIDTNFINKDHDVFCSYGHTNTGLRRQTQSECYKLQSDGRKVMIESSLPFDVYINCIKRSHIALSAWGAGNSCRRMWEILSKGTCCFAQKMEILLPNKYTDGFNIVEYSTMDEFNDKIRYYINNKDKALEIGIKGQEHTFKYHSSKKRVEYIFNVLKGANWQTAL